MALYTPKERTVTPDNKLGIVIFRSKDVQAVASSFQAGEIYDSRPIDIKAFLDEVATTVDSTGQLEKELMYETAEGETMWGVLNAYKIEIGGEKRFLFNITNIDRFKKPVPDAAMNAVQFEAVFDNSPIGMLIIDQEGKVVKMNQYCEKKFNYTTSEISGKSVEKLIPGMIGHIAKIDTNCNFPQHEQIAESEGTAFKANRKDGGQFPVDVKLSLYKVEERCYTAAFVTDLSGKNRDEQYMLQQHQEIQRLTAQINTLKTDFENEVDKRTRMLKETLRELSLSKELLDKTLEREKELSGLKSRFVSMASHEFRTPLSTILSSSYLTEQYHLTEDQEKRRKHLSKIQHAVQTLTFILEDFLSLEKIEEGRVQVNLVELTAEELQNDIKNVLEEMGQIFKKGQRFELVDVNTSAVRTDNKLLRNILVNLISNAIKYSPESSVITVSIFRKDDCLHIAVADKGIGIPEEEQQFMFNRFFRAKNASTIQGTGLGLYIVNRYLNLLNGKIEMISRLGLGTTFTIIL